MPVDPIRVLVIADQCNPEDVSVPLEGYQYVAALSRRPELSVTAVTNVWNRPALEKDPLSRRIPIEFIDHDFIAEPLLRFAHFLRGGSQLSWTVFSAMVWPVYVVFEHLVYRRFRKELRAGSFHIIHRVTPLSPTIPSPLAGLTDVPMVIGPLNGGLPWPTKQYPELLRREREWLTQFRWLYRYLPFHRSTFRHLRGVISGSRHTATEIPPWFRGMHFYLAENGVDPDRFPLASSWPEPRGRFRFISMGRLVPFKGFDLVLEAIVGSDLLRQNSELVIVGDGPMRGPLEEFVARNQLDACVRFLGRLEHRTLAEATGQSQAFVFPSLREFGGAVVLEAMAKALPVIVVDYGGPGELATPECGFMLQMAGRDVLIPKLRAAMERLVDDPDLCRAMGKAGRDRVEREFTWDAKAERLVEIYRTILESAHAPERSRSVGGATSPTASAAS